VADSVTVDVGLQQLADNSPVVAAQVRPGNQALGPAPVDESEYGTVRPARETLDPGELFQVDDPPQRVANHQPSLVDETEVPNLPEHQ